MDGTFEIVSHPFMQLFTINVFAQRNDHKKQLPGFAVVMSRRRFCDYQAVFHKVKEVVGASADVRRAMPDFERAAWKGFSSVFPEAELKGCSFHYAQALYQITRFEYCISQRRGFWINSQTIHLFTSVAPYQHLQSI